MWIIPKTLSAFVQDTEGLNLDLDERAWMLEQSAMWRSKPSSKQTWLRRLKKDAWMTHLSTRILKPSLHESFEEKYTASLEDIPVSRSVARESEKERKTQDTCGPTSESMSGQLDLFGAFSRMSEVTPRWGYGESCPIWKRMVTERSGDCSRRRKQARLTNASDASSWPTATARDHKGCYKTLVRKDGKPRGDLLPDAVNIAEKNWPTPRETMSRDATHDRGKCNLGEVVHGMANPHAGPHAPEKSSTSGKNQESWLTPKSRDYRDVENHILRTGENVRKTGQKFSVGLPTQAHMKEFPEAKKAQAKLNPNWVEQLMGLPIGWTDLGSWGMESSHKPQK